MTSDLNEEILSVRKGMWEKVSSRAHHPTKIFPFGSDSDEVMLYGSVDYGFKAGGKASKHWAAHARMVKVDGVVKMSLYQVYLVSICTGGCTPAANKTFTGHSRLDSFACDWFQS